MFTYFKLTLIVCLLIFGCVVVHAQTDSTHVITSNAESYQDNEFNVFLFSLFTLFLCGLFGAAFAGAFIAILLVTFLFCLIAFGFVSTATAIGIYKRSFAAGFTSFLMLVFGAGCSLIGCFGFFITSSFSHLPASRATVSVIGLVSGAFAGIVLAKISSTLLQVLFQRLFQKMKIIVR